ncbi:hypothetical protein ASE14_07495 [Agromyces sp. Root81]|uniref:DUF6121 family protein n=1 Tax=Agromyces sp. Root81 TaxID=1736601 RepID=UPI0006F96818|nr:DUF6121 family protein [Agromyces sp. Root81]KRC60807.1 hypothetical protein ASE14_07495 [Agromyces sp. Root81]
MDPRRTAWIVAALAAALDFALVVCAFGFVSLLTGVEVIVDPEAGLFVAPAAIGASVIAVLLTLAVTLRRPDRIWPSVILSAVWAWIALVVVSVIGYALASEASSLLAALLFGLGFGIGWFGLLVPALAAVTAAFAVLVARGRDSGMERPRWPWERDEEE